MLDSVVVTTRITSTSLDPVVAREGEALDELFAIVGRTGRSLALLSAHAEEQEVVFLPGTALRPVGQVSVDGTGLTVHLIEELVLDQTAGADGARLPRDLEALIALVSQQVSQPGRADVVGPANKYAGPLR